MVVEMTTIDFGEAGVSIDDTALLQAFGLEHLTLTQKGELVILNKIVVSRPNSGNGTKFMKALTSLADARRWTLSLTPEVTFGASSTARLRRFYRRFGFVDNKGRYADLSVNESMIRRPCR